MAGKQGDLLMALPVLRALARLHETRIHLTTSGLCWQLVPLLWEQGYFEDVVLDDSRPYQIPFETGVTNHWEFYRQDAGYNLSIQPKHYDPLCPVNWTLSYAWIAGLPPVLETFEASDFVCLPSLINHRRWHHDITVCYDEQPLELARTVVVAPEVESLDSAEPSLWAKLMDRLIDEGLTVLLVGKSESPDYRLCLDVRRADSTAWPRFKDLRGLTTVPTLARLIAEASGFIGAHSLPWHLARMAGTPAVCLQPWREGLARCLPIDTPAAKCPWVEPEEWKLAVEWILKQTVVHKGD